MKDKGSGDMQGKHRGWDLFFSLSLVPYHDTKILPYRIASTTAAPYWARKMRRETITRSSYLAWNFCRRSRRVWHQVWILPTVDIAWRSFHPSSFRHNRRFRQQDLPKLAHQAPSRMTWKAACGLLEQRVSILNEESTIDNTHVNSTTNLLEIP